MSTIAQAGSDGCCFGQEIRKLAYDGAVQSNLYGCDPRSEFFNLGYRLFRDRDTLKSTFIEAGIFDSESALFELAGKVDVIWRASFLHLFGSEMQVEICKRLVGLLSERGGSLVLGRQVGNVVVGEDVQVVNEGGMAYRHNAESFGKMWDRVGKETGMRWRVE